MKQPLDWQHVALIGMLVAGFIVIVLTGHADVFKILAGTGMLGAGIGALFKGPPGGSDQ